ncbi:hypothetical protein KIH86_19130 [Paenibacillus sp. HN-1]|uniref:hypothetical protein n=1 Tax=Paenibacillus TaxID=44249 RepID=UPI001CA910FD|nr:MULTISPECIES: hypothetical protein [Paenibacillus]MBY9082315.1 hypothetical protein [Paenibacillus sp. CGMCC 1.18879]MBY9086321.1 hypothetical protein [Paenibacillus sinensis]
MTMGYALARKGLTGLIALGCFMTAGCTGAGERPAPEQLGLALSGITGTDGVNFEGEAALTVNGAQKKDATLYYGGELKDHNSLSLYTLPSGAVRSPKPETLSAGEAATAFYSKMVKEKGGWIGAESMESQEPLPLPGMNPLSQLEDLDSLDKTVTREEGAARGTVLLRVELTPEAGLRQLSRELEENMTPLRNVSEEAKGAAYHAESVTARLAELWDHENGELQRRLKKAEVKTVYYLKVDTRRNLPKTLTRQRTVRYLTPEGKSRQEMTVMRVDFYGYR